MKKCFVSSGFKNLNVLNSFLYHAADINDTVCNLNDNIVFTDEDGSFDPVYDLRTWSSIDNDFRDYVEYIYTNNYDSLYYIYSMENALRIQDSGFLIIGSSYGRNGIDCSAFTPPAINLASSSQDSYYSYNIVERILKHNPHGIRHILLGISYYTMYCDLSKSRTRAELSAISNILYPLTNALGNSIYVPPVFLPRKSDVFDFKKVIRHYSMPYFTNQYSYFKNDHRVSMLPPYTEKSWADAENTDRDAFAKERAVLHGRQLKFTHSFHKNLSTLKQLITLCDTNDIKFYICILPMSEEYRAHADSLFKQTFYNEIQALGLPVNIIDLYDSPLFETADFIDSDHLGDAGAAKATKIVKEYVL